MRGEEKEGRKLAPLELPSETSVVSFGKSTTYRVKAQELRMMSSVEFIWESKASVPSPSRMDVNSGISIHHSPLKPVAFKHCARTIVEHAKTNNNGFDLR